jgi:hypothetical protein
MMLTMLDCSHATKHRLIPYVLEHTFAHPTSGSSLITSPLSSKHWI